MERQLERYLAAVDSRLAHQLAQHPSAEARQVVPGLRSSNRVGPERLQRGTLMTLAKCTFGRATGNKSVPLKASAGDPRSPAGRGKDEIQLFLPSWGHEAMVLSYCCGVKFSCPDWRSS